MASEPATQAAPRAKRGRPPGSGDKQPRQQRSAPPAQPAPPIPVTVAPQPTIPEESEEIAINYSTTGHIWDRKNTLPDESFTFQISQQMEHDLPDPRTVSEAQKQLDWTEWEIAIHSELDSLISRQVFGPISPASPNTHLTGYK